ncbi:MAG: hypothetical protein FIA93_01370 [Deltaproteobacteria bacterium]|nr:hypothetical protein [Deltaproteobacteria bacterium]PWB63616.1 MAG: hypothetical protein C3F14_07945 [Deltaproteobacteria bacterium]
MKPGARIILLVTFFTALTALMGGCTTAGQAARPDNPPGVAVRLPITESPDVSMRAEEEMRVLPPEPLSVGDEYRGRWLTLIEINITPPAAQETPGSAPMGAP